MQVHSFSRIFSSYIALAHWAWQKPISLIKNNLFMTYSKVFLQSSLGSLWLCLGEENGERSAVVSMQLHSDDFKHTINSHLVAACCERAKSANRISETIISILRRKQARMGREMEKYFSCWPCNNELETYKREWQNEIEIKANAIWWDFSMFVVDSRVRSRSNDDDEEENMFIIFISFTPHRLHRHRLLASVSIRR